MKIRKRITITFVSLFGFLIIGLCLFVYFTAANSQETLFYNRLEKRVEITEAFFLESENLSRDIQQKVRNQFLHTLPGEIEFVSEMNTFMSRAPEKVAKQLPDNFINSMRRQTSLKWEHENQQGVARMYQKKGEKYVVLVLAKDTFGHQYLKKLALILLFASLTTLLSAYFLSVYFSKQVLSPIAEKITKANQISASNLDLRLTVYNEQDELGMLATSFNNLLDRLQESIELEKNFVRYASHELKNPLAVILGESEVTLMTKRTQNEYIEAIEKIKDKAEKLNNLVDHFLQLSRMEAAQLKKTPVNIDEVLVEVIFELSQSKPDSVELLFHVDDSLRADDLEMNADRLLLSKVFYNLIENALKFSHTNGRVEVTLKPSSSDDCIEVSVKDDGEGISEEDLKHIYKPLYRGNTTNQVTGTGIGLALVKKIVDLHAGHIEVTSVLGKGTQFTLTLLNT